MSADAWFTLGVVVIGSRSLPATACRRRSSSSAP